MNSTPASPTLRISPVTMAVLAIMVLSLGFGVWMYATTRQQAAEISTLKADNTHLRENANATLYLMEPSEIAPAAMRGEVYLTISRSGVVALSGLPMPGNNEGYILWLVNDTDGTATAAGVISINDSGQGFTLLPADSPPYNRVAVSLETTGTTVPEGAYLLEADVLPGRG